MGMSEVFVTQILCLKEGRGKHSGHNLSLFLRYSYFSSIMQDEVFLLKSAHTLSGLLLFGKWNLSVKSWRRNTFKEISTK